MEGVNADPRHYIPALARQAPTQEAGASSGFFSSLSFNSLFGPPRLSSLAGMQGAAALLAAAPLIMIRHINFLSADPVLILAEMLMVNKEADHTNTDKDSCPRFLM